VALEAPLQKFLTVTMISLEKLKITPTTLTTTNFNIDILWLPIISIVVSAVTILASVSKTSTVFGWGRSFGLILFFYIRYSPSRAGCGARAIPYRLLC
jgi:hypothetical protein